MLFFLFLISCTGLKEVSSIPDAELRSVSDTDLQNAYYVMQDEGIAIGLNSIEITNERVQVELIIFLLNQELQNSIKLKRIFEEPLKLEAMKQYYTAYNEYPEKLDINGNLSETKVGLLLAAFATYDIDLSLEILGLPELRLFTKDEDKKFITDNREVNLLGYLGGMLGEENAEKHLQLFELLGQKIREEITDDREAARYIAQIKEKFRENSLITV